MKAREKATVTILGASSNPEKYSYKAVELLKEHGFEVIPVHPSGVSVCGTQTVKSLAEISIPVDTLSLYVNPSISSRETDAILKLKPRRVIFNPGTENQALEDICLKKGMEIIHGCTLVMLKTNAF